MAVSRLSQQSLINAFPKGTAVWDGTTAVGSMDAISFVSIPAGSTLSAVEFSNIPQTYTHLQLRALVRGNRTPVTYDNFNMRFNSDAGNNYSFHAMYGDARAGGPFAEGSSSANSMSIANIPGSASLTNSYGVAVLDIIDYSKTNKAKTVRSLGGYESNTTGYGNIYSSIAFISGAWYSTVAVNSITILPSNSPFQQFSHFALYGVK